MQKNIDKAAGLDNLTLITEEEVTKRISRFSLINIVLTVPSILSCFLEGYYQLAGYTSI